MGQSKSRHSTQGQGLTWSDPGHDNTGVERYTTRAQSVITRRQKRSCRVSRYTIYRKLLLRVNQGPTVNPIDGISHANFYGMQAILFAYCIVLAHCGNQATLR